MKFLADDGSFDADGYRHAIRIMLTAMEVMVGYATYPTERITVNSHKFRPLGLGYANLGAVLMALGLPYDSPQARDYSGALTAILTGEAYAQSARIAKEVGTFEGYEVNRQPMLRVIEKHRGAAYKIPDENAPAPLLAAARTAWDDAHELGAMHGYRNSQATVLAPTGTISFMLDCDTTGVEPDIALVKYKKLVGGGLLKMVNGTVPSALRKLGYGEEAVSAILAYINEHDTIEGAPHLREDDLAVFDCAFPPANGQRSITWQGHVRMMAAASPSSPAPSPRPSICRPGRRSSRTWSKRYTSMPGSWGSRQSPSTATAASAPAPQHLPQAGRRHGRWSMRCWRQTSPSPPSAALPNAPSDHPQVRHRRARGLSHSGHVRGRSPRRRSS